MYDAEAMGGRDQAGLVARFVAHGAQNAETVKQGFWTGALDTLFAFSSTVMC